MAAWLAAVDEDHVFLSVATVAEIRHGIERLAAGRRRERLTAWLAQELPDRFAGRVLPIDRLAAEAWGVVMARADGRRGPRHHGRLLRRERRRARPHPGHP